MCLEEKLSQIIQADILVNISNSKCWSCFSFLFSCFYLTLGTFAVKKGNAVRPSTKKWTLCLDVTYLFYPRDISAGVKGNTFDTLRGGTRGQI